MNDNHHAICERLHRLPLRLQLLALFLALSAAALGLGGWITASGMGDWYEELAKPAFQPPGWVFSPVWISLMTLMAIATWLIARHDLRRGDVQLALALFAAQLVLNVGWSWLFFGLHAPKAALAELLLFDLLMLVLLWSYWRISKLAALLVLPYVLWLGLATTLNGWIVLYN